MRRSDAHAFMHNPLSQLRSDSASYVWKELIRRQACQGNGTGSRDSYLHAKGTVAFVKLVDKNSLRGFVGVRAPAKS